MRRSRLALSCQLSGLHCDAELVLTFREQSVGGATSSGPLFLFAGGPIGG